MSLDSPMLSVCNATLGVTVLTDDNEHPSEVFFRNVESRTEYTQNMLSGIACCA